jgi:hypothetical protein
LVAILVACVTAAAPEVKLTSLFETDF